MIQLKSKFFFLLVVIIGGCTKPSRIGVPNKLTGLWTLHIMEQKDSATGEWKEWRDGMQGYLLYGEDDGMALHLTTKGYEDTDLQFPNFVDTIPLEALRHLTNSYVYFAKYEVDEENGIIKHSRISHSNPAEWNDVVNRRFSFSGDTLTLRPVEERTSKFRVRWLKSDTKK